MRGGTASKRFSSCWLLPLLFVQFRRSDRGLCVLGGYVASCGVLMLASFVMAMMLGQDPTSVFFGVPVKNEATQSGEFVTCIFGLLYVLLDVYERRRWAWTVVVLALIAGMVADIVFIATGRTALAIVPLLLAVFAVQEIKHERRR